MAHVNLKALYQEACDNFPHPLIIAGDVHIEKPNKIIHEYIFTAGQLNDEPITAAGSIQAIQTTPASKPTITAEFGLALNAEWEANLELFDPYLGVLNGRYDINTKSWELAYEPAE